ncbi:hypothetical protein D9615_009041 [Tricholomella constricta]|uniref:MARVEL domain-containing protein n=1 Tax=Tricholomella constricta TaxID=117010 RepID=A0A8H5H064_9AGAR|nr:hypothetical protein D9615_009041 [Tricholomella constricta]
MPPEPERTTIDSSELNLLLRPRRRHTRSPVMDRRMADIPKAHAEQKQNASATTRTRAAYHPALFTVMACSALAELGLTAFLVSAGNEHNTWPSSRYHALLILFLFNAAWTVLFSTAYLLWFVEGASHLLASIASSVVWLLITSVLWGTAAGVMHNTRTGGNCAGRATISRSVGYSPHSPLAPTQPEADAGNL